MKTSKRAVALFIAFMLNMNLLLVPASADSPFVDNPHWSEVSAQTVTQLYNNKSSFVVMFFRYSCFNSNLRKVMLSDWMTDYDLDVYGVDVDTYSIPSWVWAGIKTQSVTLPVICIVDHGKADCFTVSRHIR